MTRKEKNKTLMLHQRNSQQLQGQKKKKTSTQVEENNKSCKAECPNEYMTWKTKR